MGDAAARPPFSRRGLVRALRRGVLALALFLGGYVALVQLDVVRSPLDPSLGGDIELARSARPGLRVLFVGNSLTYENALPSLVHDLAAGDPGAPTIIAASYTAPAWRFRSAARDDGLRALLRDVSWDAVVLQEASRIPALAPAERRREMNPYAHGLVRAIRTTGARPLLFLTWAHREGDGDVRGDTYAWMQARVRAGYEAEAAALGVDVVPVGLAWAAAVGERPELELWEDDGLHPSRLGSYLAACVFYEALTGRPPTRSSFTAGLPRSDALFAQRAAADIGYGSR